MEGTLKEGLLRYIGSVLTMRGLVTVWLLALSHPGRFDQNSKVVLIMIKKVLILAQAIK